MKKLLLCLGLLLALAIGSHSSEQANELARTLQITYTNQAGAISQVTELSPSVNTGYLVTSHVAVHGTNGGNTLVTPQFSYTDAQGFTHNANGGSGVSSDQVADGEFFIYAKGGTNVTFATVYSGGTDNASYDVVITVFQQ
jgi:hypothetical protein